MDIHVLKGHPRCTMDVVFQHSSNTVLTGLLPVQTPPVLTSKIVFKHPSLAQDVRSNATSPTLSMTESSVYQSTTRTRSRSLQERLGTDQKHGHSSIDFTHGHASIRSVLANVHKIRPSPRAGGDKCTCKGRGDSGCHLGWICPLGDSGSPSVSRVGVHCLNCLAV